MSYAVEELRAGIVDMFEDATQRSHHFCAYNEMDAFIMRRGSGASAYRCESCGSTSETHRCVIRDKVPPVGFSCWVPPASARRSERLRVAAQDRYRRSKKTLEHLAPKIVACEMCGARAPQHRCTVARSAT